jgi:hypothetical protein
MTPRDEDILNFMQSDRIWPALLNTPSRKRFNTALVTVLHRLPDDAFDQVYDDVWFVVQEPTYRALNVPYSRILPASQYEREFKIHQVVIFNTTFDLSDEAIVGIIAHELAHSIVEYPDHFQNESAADGLVKTWGFERQLGELVTNRRKEAHFPGTPDV